LDEYQKIAILERQQHLKIMSYTRVSNFEETIQMIILIIHSIDKIEFAISYYR